MKFCYLILSAPLVSLSACTGVLNPPAIQAGIRHESPLAPEPLEVIPVSDLTVADSVTDLTFNIQGGLPPYTVIEPLNAQIDDSVLTLPGRWTLPESGIQLVKVRDSAGVLTEKSFGLTWTGILAESSAAESNAHVEVFPNGEIRLVNTTAGSQAKPSAGGLDVVVGAYSVNGTKLWEHQFGGAIDDLAGDVLLDSATGATFVVGSTLGNILGAGLGSYDAYLVRYESDGTVGCSIQFGGPNRDQAYSVIKDDTTGDLIVAGITTSNMSGTSVVRHAMFYGYDAQDAFVARFHTDCSLQTVQQYQLAGTRESYGDVRVRSNPAGGFYLYSRDYDEIDGSGNDVVQFLTSSLVKTSEINLVAGYATVNFDLDTDLAGNAYVLGGVSTSPVPTGCVSQGTSDQLFVLKLNATGTQLWCKTWVSDNSSRGNFQTIRIAENSVYVGGSIAGVYASSAIARGGRDALLVRLSSMTGTQTDFLQWGTSGDDGLTSVAFWRDSLSSQLYIFAGLTTNGSVNGHPTAGQDALILKFDEQFVIQ